jgi:hypothetical protein
VFKTECFINTSYGVGSFMFNGRSLKCVSLNFTFGLVLLSGVKSVKALNISL